jgi:hypothetical protein
LQEGGAQKFDVLFKRDVIEEQVFLEYGFVEDALCFDGSRPQVEMGKDEAGEIGFAGAGASEDRFELEEELRRKRISGVFCGVL